MRDDPQDTLVFDTMVLAGSSRDGSVDLDDYSRTVDGSSTQGTPSTIGGRRSARLALRSAANSSPRALSILRPRKRQSTPDLEQRSSKLRKASEARSPFHTGTFEKVVERRTNTKG
jgi:hypothetical protein